jgi:hypothetical protein
MSLSLPPGVVGVSVQVDGTAIPEETAKNEIPLDPGPHRIVVTARDREPFAANMEAKEREHTELDVRMNPTAPPPRPLEPPPADNRRVGAIASTAGAVALITGGVLAFSQAGREQAEARRTCAALLVPCDDLSDPIRTWDALALAGWVGGAGLGVLSVFLWKDIITKPKQTAVVVTPGGLLLRGSF